MLSASSVMIRRSIVHVGRHLPSLTKCPSLASAAIAPGQFHQTILTATISVLVSKFLLRRAVMGQRPLWATEVKSVNWLMNEGCIP